MQSPGSRIKHVPYARAWVSSKIPTAANRTTPSKHANILLCSGAMFREIDLVLLNVCADILKVKEVRARKVNFQRQQNLFEPIPQPVKLRKVLPYVFGQEV